MAHEKPQAYEYRSLNEAPEAWRVLQGGRLNLQQLNSIIKRAYELGEFAALTFENNLQSDPNAIPPFSPSYGAARAEFIEAHEKINGVWITKKEGQ